MKRLAELCAQKHGSLTLRPLQLETLERLAQGEHVFAGLPTGYGKSACYWIPAQAWRWRVWVISPLVSLIEDQALACEKLGINALAMKGGAKSEARRIARARLEGGEWQICFLSPERLQGWARSGYLQKLRGWGLDPDLIVLDEMHCLEEWRYFRSGYRELFERVRDWVSRGSLLLGLSASLPERESRAWMQELCGGHARVAAGLGRANLRLKVIPLEEEQERWLLLAEALKNVKAPQAALVYCGTRRETDEVTRWLRSAGIDACAYHAGLPPAERSARSRAFKEGHLRVICATSAFGMGIDYPEVCLVVHFSMPHDLESYWQEVGRAGRNGQDATALAFWRRSEIFRLKNMKPGSEAHERFVALWRAWIQGDCRKQAVAERMGFAWDAQEECGNCDRCLAKKGAEAAQEPWWLKREALPEEWLEEKIKSNAGAGCLEKNPLRKNS